MLTAQALKQNDTTQQHAIGFFLVLVLAAFIFIRPQEIIPALYGLPIIASLTVVCLLLALITRRPIQLETPHYALIALVPVIVLSGILNGWAGGGVRSGLNFITGSLFPLLIFSLMLTTASRHKLFMLLSLVAAVLIVHNGHVQQNSWDGFGWAGSEAIQDTRIRYIGILHDPNDVGMFLMINLPFAMFFLKHGNPLHKLAMLAVIPWLLYGVYMTNSRGTMLGIAGIIGLYFLLRYGGIKALIASALATPVFLTIAAGFRAVSADEASARGRLWAWWEGLEMLRANPLFGVGRGNFTNFNDLVAHNTFVQVFAELGLIGYSLWIVALFFTLLIGYHTVNHIKAHRKEKVAEETAIAVTYFYSLIAFCLAAFFITRDNFVIYYIVLGAAIAAYQMAIQVQPSIKPDVKQTTKIALGAGLAIIPIVYLMLKVTL